METEVMSMSLKQAENKLNFERQKRQKLEKEIEDLSAMEARSVVAAGASVDHSFENVSELQKVPLTLKRRRSSDSALYCQSKKAKLDFQQAAEEEKVQMMDFLEKTKVELAEMFEDCKEEIIANRIKIMKAVNELALDLKEHKTDMTFKLREIYDAQQLAVGIGKSLQTPEFSGKESVFTVQAKDPVQVTQNPHQYLTIFTFGLPGKGQGQFDWPSGIAVSERTGNIAVADWKNKRIQMFSSEGEYLREFGQKGPRAERLSLPYSVAFTRSGVVIVSHGSVDQPYKISVFAESGEFIKHIINEHLKSPMRVSVGRDGHLIVCDWGDNTIKVLSPDGTELLQSFNAPDCDASPWFAVYHQDNFLVSYYSAHCVKVFNKEGVFLYNIGSKGSGDGQLNGPRGLAVDKFNNLVLCDCYNNRLQMFSLDGTFVTKTEGPLTGLGGLTLSLCLTMVTCLLLITRSAVSLFFSEQWKTTLYR